MYLKTKSGRLVALPSDDEDAQINQQILNDPDAFEADDNFFEQARPASEVLHELFSPEIAAEMLRPKKSGRPHSENPKIFTGIRLDADVLNSFKSTGKGWQTRMNNALKEWLLEHHDFKHV
jgi:uncharacterized protein (DUF4415 family)